MDDEIEPEEVMSNSADEAISADEAMDGAMPTLEEFVQAMIPGARAVHSKLVDIAHTNLNVSLRLARDLAQARTPLEAMRLQIAYWQDCFALCGSQTQDLCTLYSELLTTASKPIRAHPKRP